MLCFSRERNFSGEYTSTQGGGNAPEERGSADEEISAQRMA